MALVTKLELRQGQQLVMTPQLQQAIRLLQLSNVELSSFVEAELESNQKKSPARIVINEEKPAAGKSSGTVVRLTLGEVPFSLEPLKGEQGSSDLKDPPNSGGLLMALYQYRRLLTLGEKGFEQYFNHGGNEPFYPMPVDETVSASLADLRVDTEVLQTEHAATPVKWYFSRKDQSLLGFEATALKDEDPSEVYFSDYRKVDGRELPHRIEVRYGNGRFGVFNVTKYDLAVAEKK